MNPLDKARELILSLTSEDDASQEIDKISALNSTEQTAALTALYETAQKKAADGDTKAISIILRVCEHFGDKSHDRMLLHYIAQAEANQALAISKNEKPGEFHHQDLQKALEIISAAFADADEINKTTGVS